MIATASTEAKARSAHLSGAHHVVDYRDETAADRVRAIVPEGVRTIVEVAAAVNVDLDRRVLAQGGALVSYANAPDEQLVLPMMPFMNLNARVQFVRLFAIGAGAYSAAVEDVTAAAAAGALSVGAEVGLPVHRFPLERAAEAHAAAESGRPGKVLVDVADL